MDYWSISSGQKPLNIFPFKWGKALLRSQEGSGVQDSTGSFQSLQRNGLNSGCSETVFSAAGALKGLEQQTDPLNAGQYILHQ